MTRLRRPPPPQVGFTELSCWRILRVLYGPPPPPPAAAIPSSSPVAPVAHAAPLLEPPAAVEPFSPTSTKKKPSSKTAADSARWALSFIKAALPARRQPPRTF